MATIDDQELADLYYELDDLQNENFRHHRDFKKISEIIENCFNDDGLEAIGALKEIRNIVG